MQAESVPVFTNVPLTAPRTGLPIPARQEITMPSKWAQIREQRGQVQPAARFYLAGLKRLGVAHITIREDADPSVAVEAKKLGIRCFTAEGEVKPKAAPAAKPAAKQAAKPAAKRGRGRPKKTT